VLSDEADVLYKCTTLWDRETDRSLIWNDPEIGIDWPFQEPSLSPKDAAGKRLRDAEIFAD
jgi:dTDP-4-dehydrorhamnose 3,5-epimerase